MEDSHRIRAALSLLNIKPGLLLRHYDFEETGRYRKVFSFGLIHLSLFLAILIFLIFLAFMVLWPSKVNNSCFFSYS